MSYRLVTFDEPAFRWLQRHGWMSHLKVKNLVQFGGSDVDVVESDQTGIHIIRAKVRKDGELMYVFIKYRDLSFERKVVGIHSQSIRHPEVRR
jgi:hypothetical protein